MQVIEAQVAREAITELKAIATQGIVEGDTAQRLLGALRRVIRTAESHERMIEDASIDIPVAHTEGAKCTT